MATKLLLLFLLLSACTQQTLPTETVEIVEEGPETATLEPEIVQIPTSYMIKSPDEVYFWINNMLIPEATLYNGSQFLSIRTSQIRTFAGLFGPYFDDPSKEINVVLCAELAKIQAPLSCETMDLVFRDKYVSFAKGFGPDEYIGGRVYKDYAAYFNVYQGNTTIAVSRKAVIRTVN